MHLINWVARRAGGRITINGHEAYADGSQGPAAKIVGVDKIEPIAGKIVATDKTGTAHTLGL